MSAPTVAQSEQLETLQQQVREIRGFVAAFKSIALAADLDEDGEIDWLGVQRLVEHAARVVGAAENTVDELHAAARAQLRGHGEPPDDDDPTA